MLYSYVSGFGLNLASVATSSVYCDFEKHTSVLERKKRKCFQKHGLQGFAVGWANGRVALLRGFAASRRDAGALLLLAWLHLFPQQRQPSCCCVFR